MAQPLTQKDQLGIALLTLEQLEEMEEKKKKEKEKSEKDLTSEEMVIQ